jgi:hypothetical protein
MGFSARTLFYAFTSSEQSYAAALCQDTQQQEPQALQTDGESVHHSTQQHLPQQEFQKTGVSIRAPSSLPQQEFQKTGVSIRAPSSSDNDKLKVATVVHQIMKELSAAVSKENKVMIMT